MSASTDSQAYYKKRLDKWRARSARVFTRAQSLNRTLDKQLSTAVKSLERNRDLAIRRDQERIWLVTGSKIPAKKYTKDDYQPSYLGKHFNATLPTPQELSSLLPNKKAKQRTQSAGNYTQLSRRRLSSMSTDDLNIYHYRKALESLRDKYASSPLYSEVIAEGEEEGVADATVENEQVNTDVRSTPATPVVPSATPEQSPVLPARPKTAVELAALKKREQRARSPIPNAARRRKRRESIPNATALMIEQAQDPKNKVLRTNFLDMYQRQLVKHQRRMSTIQEHHVDRQRRKNAPLSAPSKRANVLAKWENDSRPATVLGVTEEEEEEPYPDDDYDDEEDVFQEDKQPPSLRQSLQSMRRTSLAAVSGMNALHNEIKSVNSYRKFKRESLGILENDIPSIDDLEEGELFDEMRKVRYIRWGQDEELVEELNEDQPLVNQLQALTIDTTKKPKRFLKKMKEHNEPSVNGR
ncbi:uncharacterized protein [Diadema setosum]|uniref:uncharacterized protein n=1 Tax=Diadema setosum TaxID=31175 RepID=UPI003B3B92A9